MKQALTIEINTKSSFAQVQILPAADADGYIAGVDGRRYQLDAHAVINQSMIKGRDIVVDYEHAQEIKAPEGEQADASGWIKALHVASDGSVWADVSWTQRALDKIRNKAYRYLSPAFLVDKATQQIQRITSVGLVNQPNLVMQALNRATTAQKPSQTENEMNFKRTLVDVLGLPPETSDDELITKTRELATETNRVDLEKVIPRADFDEMKTRALNAEKRLQERDQNDFNDKVEQSINKALNDGKITPATVEYHLNNCRDEKDLKAFEAYVASIPSAQSVPDKAPEKDTDEVELNAEQAHVARVLGKSTEEFKKTLSEA